MVSVSEGGVERRVQAVSRLSKSRKPFASLFSGQRATASDWQDYEDEMSTCGPYTATPPRLSLRAVYLTGLSCCTDCHTRRERARCVPRECFPMLSTLTPPSLRDSLHRRPQTRGTT